MRDEGIKCLRDIINELKTKKNETLVESDISNLDEQSIIYKKGEKKQTHFRLGMKNKVIYRFYPMYIVECSDGCRIKALLFYSDIYSKEKALEENNQYKIYGYPALDRLGNLIIISGETYSGFITRLKELERAIAIKRLG